VEWIPSWTDWQLFTVFGPDLRSLGVSGGLHKFQNFPHKILPCFNVFHLSLWVPGKIRNVRNKVLGIKK
jgi:hypothetical protein